MKPHPFLILALCLLPSACRAGGDAPPPPEPALRVALPWTQAFRSEAVLVAEEIRIEGPAELVQHLALRQHEETATYAARTLPEGFLQELVARPGASVELRAQLDAWSLAALRRITVLQRPGPVAVTVCARGDAYWAAADGSGEKRGAELVFQGRPGE